MKGLNQLEAGGASPVASVPPDSSATIYAGCGLTVEEKGDDYKVIRATDPVELVLRHMDDGWKLRVNYSERRAWLSRTGLHARSVEWKLFLRVERADGVETTKDSDGPYLHTPVPSVERQTEGATAITEELSLGQESSPSKTVKESVLETP